MLRDLTRSPALLLACLTLSSGLVAQPSEPTPAEAAALKAMSEIDPKVQRDGEPWTVDPSSREESRQFFRSIYGATEGVPSEWNGNTATGDPGTTSAAFKASVIGRVNFYRAMVGVPAAIALNNTFSAKAQQGALMSSANDDIDHSPPTSWTHYTADGAEASDKGNLALGTFGTESIDGYIRDHGSNNAAVGHRRWIFMPQLQEMGTGDVEAQGGFRPANTLWVNDGRVFDTRPATREEFVAWPAPGHVPYQLVWPRWSITLPGANFSGATVSMTRNGTPISTFIEAGNQSLGNEVTLVWLYDGKSGNDLASHDKPSADVDYEVTVAGVNVGGSTRTFNYTVTVFDPDAAGADTTEATISGTGSPKTNQSNTYTVNAPSFASGIQWRELVNGSNSTAYGAEELNSHPEIDGTSDSYSLWLTGTAATGNGSFHLAHPVSSTQSFTLPGIFAVPPSGAVSLSFASKLGFATVNQIARAEVSINGGKGWAIVYEQAGDSDGSSPTESSFQNRSVDLAAYAGQTIRVRFTYSHTSGSYFNQTGPTIGWLIDDVRLNGGIMSVEEASISNHIAGSSFTFSPATNGPKILQARGMFFGNYGMDWGPTKTVIAETATSTSTGNSRIVNLSVRANAATGLNTLNVGMVVGGSGTKPVVVRVLGPAIDPFVEGAAPDPALQIFRDGSEIHANDNWDSSLRPVFTSLGAFPLEDGSRDAAIDVNLQPKLHSVLVDTQGNNGVVVVEAYDKDAIGTGTSKLINISARNQVGTGSNVLIAGFGIQGTGQRTLLIRGVGASLAPFLDGTLANPQLVIKPLGSESVLASNDNWNSDPDVAAAASTVGAFELTSDLDAALLVTLPAGSYTATVSGVNETTGIGLVEVYEVP